MRCTEVEKHLEEWLERKESLPELATHVAECHRCWQLATGFGNVQTWLNLLRQEPPTLDPAFWVRLRQRIEAASQRQEVFWAAFNTLAQRTAVGLAVLLLLLSLFGLRQPQPLSITELEPVQEDLLAANGEMTRDQVLLSLAGETESWP